MRVMVRGPSIFHPLSRFLAGAVAVVLLCFASGAFAKPARVSAGDWRVIQAVISKQMQAFRLDDGEEAFALASPGIRQVFESADSFMEMVRTEYSAVYRPRTFRFLKPAVLEGEPVQPVEVVALDGAMSIAVFSMERQPNRSWRISGCRLIESKQFAI